MRAKSAAAWVAYGAVLGVVLLGSIGVGEAMVGRGVSPQPPSAPSSVGESFAPPPQPIHYTAKPQVSASPWPKGRTRTIETPQPTPQARVTWLPPLPAETSVSIKPSSTPDSRPSVTSPVPVETATVATIPTLASVSGN